MDKRINKFLFTIVKSRFIAICMAAIMLAAATGCQTTIKEVEKEQEAVNEVTQKNIPANAVRIYMENENKGWIIDEAGTLFSTENGWEEYSEMRQFSWSTEGSAIPDITYVDGKLIVSGFLEEDTVIGIFSSSDGGQTWKESRLDYSDNDAGAYQLFLSFPSSEVGYLLYCGAPAVGIMPKILYRTDNGGDSFEKIGDISSADVHGYPTGMAFSKEQEGVITCMEHGNGDTYLYSTKDAGIQWNSQLLDVGENNYVVSAYQPKFTGQEGNLLLQISHAEDRIYAVYHTSDYGNTWLFDTEIDSIPYCFDYISNDTLYGSDGTDKLIMIRFHENGE